MKNNIIEPSLQSSPWVLKGGLLPSGSDNDVMNTSLTVLHERN